MPTYPKYDNGKLWYQPDLICIMILRICDGYEVWNAAQNNEEYHGLRDT